MNFLNPALLWWLVPLLAAPVIIHALNKKFPKLFAFSSVDRLQTTVARQSKLFRFRHWILLALRTCFIALLLLAFLKPVLPRMGSQAAVMGKRRVLIVMDHSLSMEYMGGGLPPRKRAVVEAEKIVDSLRPGDLINVLLAGQTPKVCFAEFSNNTSEARRFIDNTHAGLSAADFNQANAAACRLLARSADPAEVFFISDFQRRNWEDVDFNVLPEKTRLFFVDVGSGARENTAILGASLERGRVLAGETVPLEIEVGNYTGRTLETHVNVLIDNRAQFDKPVSVPPWSATKTTVSIQPGAPGLHFCEISLPDDELPQDNHHHLVIETLEKEEVLIVSDEPDTSKSGVFYLGTALNPYENSRGSLLPRRITTSGLTPDALAGVSKVFVCRAGRMNETNCATLARFIFGGGGVVLFLDGESDRENLAGLEHEMGENTMPLKLGERRRSDNVAAGAQQFGSGDFKSPYLRLFRGEMRQNLAAMEFYDYYRAGATGAGTVLLKFADGSPAMAEVNYGSGALLLMNFSASEYSGNLARQRVFPAWIQEIAKSIGVQKETDPARLVGEPITAEVWRNELREGGLKSPSGVMITPAKEVVGDRYVISFTPDEPGFYTLGGSDPAHAFGVNTSPEEADLRAIDREALPHSVGKGGRVAGFVEGAHDYDDLARGRPLFHWFIAAALFFLVVELLFQQVVRSR